MRQPEQPWIGSRNGAAVRDQTAQGAHAIVAILFIALILGHIDIGTLAMERALETMGTAEGDLNRAKERHGLCLAQQLRKEHETDGR